jgi:hypothetical protein
MSAIEIILWGVTAIIVLAMLGQTSDIAVNGIRFWLRPSAWLILRVPILLLAILCIFGGIELVYDINARVWFSEMENGHIGFRWWMLFFTPIVLTISSLGFTVPYLAFFLLIPHLQHSERLGFVARSLLSSLVVLVVPVLVYAVTSVI